MKLTGYQKQSLELDKRTLQDLGLSMPRCTGKYLQAVYTLSKLGTCSPYFYHLIGARKGTSALYKDLSERGFTWLEGRWTERIA